MNFIPLELITPIIDPKAGFIASLIFLPAIISPVKAPRNAPINKPNGMGLSKPIIKPIVVPMTPYFVPPNSFDPIIGIK